MISQLPYAWSPREPRNAKLALWCANTDALKQEPSLAGTYVGTPSAYTTAVGSANLCQDAHILSSITALYAPTLQQDANNVTNYRNSFLRFGHGSQPSNLALQNSTGCFRHIWQTGCFSIWFWLRMQTGGSVGGDGVGQTIFDNNDNAQANVGMYLQRESNNTFEFVISGRNSVSTYQAEWISVLDSTATFTSSSGWAPIGIVGCGPGTNTLSLYIGGSIVNGVFVPTLSKQANINGTYLIPAGGGGSNYVDPIYNFAIGTTGGNTIPGQFDLENFIITEGPLDQTDLTNWYNFNPPQTPVTLARSARPWSQELEPNELEPGYWGEWDFSRVNHRANEQPMLFTGTSPSTTQVEKYTDSIGYAEHYGGRYLNRYLSAPGTAPTWQQGPGPGSGATDSAASLFGQISNPSAGTPCCLFAGSGSGPTTTTPTALNFKQAIPPGDVTILIVAQNNNNQANPTTGNSSMISSHLLTYSQGASTYFGIGGKHLNSPSVASLYAHLAGANAGTFFGTCAPTITSVTVSGSSGSYTPFDPRGVYTLVSPSWANLQATNAYYYYKCNSTQGGQVAYLWTEGNNWVISSPSTATPGGPGVNGSSYWSSGSDPYQLNSSWTVFNGTGTVAASALTPGGGNTPSGLNIFALQCKNNVALGGVNGAVFRAGVNGAWFPWTGSNANPTQALLGVSLGLNNMGNDGHMNTGGPRPTTAGAYLCFELNAYVAQMVVYTYVHPDYMLNKVLRRMGNRFSIPNMTLSE